MIAAKLPEWANSDNLRWIALGVIAAMAFLMFIVARFVQKILVKLVLLALFGGIGVVAWIERADLADCAKTCDCRLLGQEVEIPKGKNPVCDR